MKIGFHRDVYPKILDFLQAPYEPTPEVGPVHHMVISLCNADIVATRFEDGYVCILVGFAEASMIARFESIDEALAGICEQFG